MNQSMTAISVLVILFLIGMSGLTLASQDRRPVDPPSPKPQEPSCPDDSRDRGCSGNGTGKDKVFAWALNMAGTACQHELNDCFTEQGAELALNKTTCEAVEGCKLKYTTTFDACESGNYKNCTPLPGTGVEDKDTMFTCTIKGEYDIEDYRCDREPANEGEQTA